MSIRPKTKYMHEKDQPQEQPENLLQKFVKQQTQDNPIKATLKSTLEYLGIKDFQYRIMKNWCNDALPVGLVRKIEELQKGEK